MSIIWIKQVQWNKTSLKKFSLPSGLPGLGDLLLLTCFNYSQALVYCSKTGQCCCLKVWPVSIGCHLLHKQQQTQIMIVYLESHNGYWKTTVCHVDGNWLTHFHTDRLWFQILNDPNWIETCSGDKIIRVHKALNSFLVTVSFNHLCHTDVCPLYSILWRT